MTDTPLLRLARALLDGAEGHATFDETTDRMRSLVRDLEAAPPPETGLEPRGCPTPGACSCPVARRTITRKDIRAAVSILRRLGTKFEEDVTAIAAAWRLTVED